MKNNKILSIFVTTLIIVTAFSFIPNVKADPTLCEALDNCDLEWASPNDRYYGQTNTYYYDNDAAECTDTGGNLKATVYDSKGTLRFHWRTTCKNQNDGWEINFWIRYKDGGTIEQTSATLTGNDYENCDTGWQQYEYTLTEKADYEFIWMFSDFNGGDDTGNEIKAWVDKVEWIENNPPDCPYDENPSEGTVDIDIDENNGNSVTIQCTVSDPEGDDLHVAFYEGAGKHQDKLLKYWGETEVESGDTLRFNWTGLSYNTTYEWHCYVYDNDKEVDSASSDCNNGLWSFTTELDPDIDVTPPITTITEPDNNEGIYGKSITFKFTGSDDKTATENLSYSYNFKKFRDDDLWSDWTNETTLTFTDLEEWSYYFSVKAKDEAGNIDTDPPQILVFLYYPDEWFPDTNITKKPDKEIDYSTVEFEYIGSDDTTPVEKLQYSYCLVDRYALDPEIVWSEWTYKTSVTFTDINGGAYEFGVKAKDQDGLEDRSEATWYFTNVLMPDLKIESVEFDKKADPYEFDITLKNIGNIELNTDKLTFKFRVEGEDDTYKQIKFDDIYLEVDESRSFTDLSSEEITTEYVDSTLDIWVFPDRDIYEPNLLNNNYQISLPQARTKQANTNFLLQKLLEMPLFQILKNLFSSFQVLNL